MRTAVTAIILALAALTLTGCGGSNQGVGVNGYPSGNGVYQLVPADRRGEPVALSGPTLSGARLDVATLRGQIVVLNVWGSWCIPCQKEAKALVAAQADLTGAQAPAGAKVSFVGINTRDNTPGALSFERQFQITYPSLVDDGKLLLALRGTVPPDAVPVTLVLDPQGRVAARFSGEISRATLVDLVHDVAGTTSRAVSPSESPSESPSALPSAS